MSRLLLSVSEAARYLNVGRTTVRNLIAANEVKIVSVPGRRNPLITKASIDAWLALEPVRKPRTPREAFEWALRHAPGGRA